MTDGWQEKDPSPVPAHIDPSNGGVLVACEGHGCSWCACFGSPRYQCIPQPKSWGRLDLFGVDL